MRFNQDDLDAAAEEIRNIGYTVILSGFSTQDRELRKAG
jgi:hypothetical protein